MILVNTRSLCAPPRYNTIPVLPWACFPTNITMIISVARLSPLPIAFVCASVLPKLEIHVYLIYWVSPAARHCLHVPPRYVAPTCLLPCVMSVHVVLIDISVCELSRSQSFKCAVLLFAYTAERKARCLNGIPVTILTGAAWTDTRDLWCRAYPSEGAPFQWGATFRASQRDLFVGAS